MSRVLTLCLASHTAFPAGEYRVLWPKRTSLFSKTVCQHELSCEKNHFISPLGEMSSSNGMSPIEPSNPHLGVACSRPSKRSAPAPSKGEMEMESGTNQCRGTCGRWQYSPLWRKIKFACFSQYKTIMTVNVAGLYIQPRWCHLGACHRKWWILPKKTNTKLSLTSPLDGPIELP